MSQLPRRKRGGYFPMEAEVPLPLVVRLKHRVRFSDVDAMGVVWHGRYANLFEQANEEIGRSCGLSYDDFKRERLLAPIVQLHVDFCAGGAGRAYYYRGQDDLARIRPHEH